MKVVYRYTNSGSTAPPRLKLGSVYYVKSPALCLGRFPINVRLGGPQERIGYFRVEKKNISWCLVL